MAQFNGKKKRKKERKRSPHGILKSLLKLSPSSNILDTNAVKNCCQVCQVTRHEVLEAVIEKKKKMLRIAGKATAHARDDTCTHTSLSISVEINLLAGQSIKVRRRYPCRAVVDVHAVQSPTAAATVHGERVNEVGQRVTVDVDKLAELAHNVRGALPLGLHRYCRLDVVSGCWHRARRKATAIGVGRLQAGQDDQTCSREDDAAIFLHCGTQINKENCFWMGGERILAARISVGFVPPEI